VIRADIFPVLWQFLSARLRRVFGFSRGAFLAAAGGEMRSNYFKNRAPARNCQIRLARFGGLGNQIVRNFRRKNQLAVLSPAKLAVKENFFNYY